MKQITSSCRKTFVTSHRINLPQTFYYESQDKPGFLTKVKTEVKKCFIIDEII